MVLFVPGTQAVMWLLRRNLPELSETGAARKLHYHFVLREIATYVSVRSFSYVLGHY
jgi:hypothetical protein